MLKASFFSQLVLLGAIFTYSKFEPISFGSTANPVVLLSILSLTLVFANRIPPICLQILQRALFYLPISTLFVYLYARSSNLLFDIRFLATSFAFFFLSICFIGFGAFLTSLRSNNFRHYLIIFQNLLNSLIIVLCLIAPLNILSLHCILFKCRIVSGSIGLSLVNSEPSYVGIFLFSILTFSFYVLNDPLLRNNSSLAFKSKFLIFLSFVLLILSKSPLAVASVALYALLLLFTQGLVYLFGNYRFSIPSRFSSLQVYGALLLLILTPFVLFYTKVGVELFSLVDPNRYLPIYLSQGNPFQTLVFLGGNRFSYLLSLIYIDPTLLLSGHSLFASSDLFESAVSLFYENVMKVGFFSVYGAKPHSALGQLIFTFGALGSLFIYYPVLKLFFRGLSTISRGEASFFELWLLLSPLFSLIYFTPNTDPWKFFTIMFFVALTCSYCPPSNANNIRAFSA